jgi:Fe-S-cluster containining protein
LHCSNCGVCCKKTMMELSTEDIRKLESMGFRLENFTIMNDDVTQLRNVNGYCYFYSISDTKCKIYENRPVGCTTYPVVYLLNEGPIVDEICPMGHTISKQELITKGKILGKLLKKIDNDRSHYQNVKGFQVNSKVFLSTN